MVDIDFNKYFGNTEKKYYKSKYLITILEDILSKDFSAIKNDVNNAKVMVSEKEIIKFLEQKLEEENPELKKRIESSKHKQSSNIGDWTNQDRENYKQELKDQLSIDRYCFSSYTLKYFNRYSTIVREKALCLLKIIEKIGNNKSIYIKNLIIDLDIILDDDGNISKEDIIRLITPTVYNINELEEKIIQANSLSTYLTFKISKHSLFRYGIDEEEIYPRKSLQIKDLLFDNINGCVPLSDRQIKKIQQEDDERYSKNVQMVLDLFD